MAFAIEITRPDDLLRLRIEARNLRVDRGDAAPASLVVDDAAKPAFLLVQFAPQAIAEGAYYEATIVKVEPDVPPPPDGKPQPPPTTIEAPGPPGTTRVRIAQGSRLVFKVPANARVPLTIEGLLDWSALELNVNPIAAIGPEPTAAQIAGAPAIARPADTETAIELPYKLVVSPTAGIGWEHRLPAFTSRGRTELWHTRMVWPGPQAPEELTAQKPASLRAIWSDDFNTVDGLNPDQEDRQLHRAAMTPNDRHQIVVKTSAFHGYEGEITIAFGGGIGGLGGGLRAADGVFAERLSPIIGAGIELKYWVPYVPQPFYADQVMLSSQGGWLRSRGSWNLVRKARPRFRFEALDLSDVLRRFDRGPRAAGTAAGPLNAVGDVLSTIEPIGLEFLRPATEAAYLDLSEWVHIATQGRDHYVRIVDQGELLPFRNRAALVKVTERKFKDEGGSLIAARMYQRYFIVVREPEKQYAATDRGMPFKKVRLTTLVTPDIADPKFEPVGSRSFWVEVMTSATSRVRFPFHVVGTDAGGNEVDFTIPMMFLSQAAQGTVRTAVIDNYNNSSTTKAMADRSAVVPGHKILFAERDGASPTDNSLLVTRTLTFALHNNEATRLLKAEVNVPQVQELLGTNAPTTIRLYPDYVDAGFDAGSALFAEIVKRRPPRATRLPPSRRPRWA